MKVVDYIMLAVFVIALVAIFYFWGCHLDPVVTAVAGMIAILSGLCTFLQYRRLSELKKKDPKE